MPTPSLPLGTRLFVYGNLQLALQLAASSATATMSFLSHSLPTTVKSSLGLVTVQSSSGTLWETANLPSPTRVIPSGFRAYASAQILRIRSLSALGGTSLSRYATIFIRGWGNSVTGCFAIYKYLLLQSFRAMRQTFTNALMTTTKTPSIVTCVDGLDPSLTAILSSHRSGNSPPAAFKPTTSATPATLTPSPSLPTAPSAPPVVRMERPCSGTLTSRSISTP